MKEFLRFLKQRGKGKALIAPNNNKQFDMEACLQRSTMTWQFVGVDQKQYTVTFYVFPDGGVALVNNRWTVSGRHYQWALAVQTTDDNPQPFDVNCVSIDDEEDNSQKKQLIEERVVENIGQFLFVGGHTAKVYTGPGVCSKREKKIMWNRMQTILRDLIDIDVSFRSSFRCLSVVFLIFLPIEWEWCQDVCKGVTCHGPKMR